MRDMIRGNRGPAVHLRWALGGPRSAGGRAVRLSGCFAARAQVDDRRRRSLDFLFPEACRYRLGVRTRGSQPRDRGSNPRTGTNFPPLSDQVPRLLAWTEE